MTPAPQLTLSEDHIYRLGDRVLPGTTEIISAVIPRKYSPGQWYMDRGSALHQAIHLLAKNDLDWSTVDESYKGKLAAFQRFMDDSRYRINASELRLHSPSLNYAGQIDALMSDDASADILVDFKSSLEPQVAIQLGAYRRLLWDNNRDVKMGMALELHDDATYKCQWFNKAELKRAEQVFCACLTVFGFMQKHKLNQKE